MQTSPEGENLIEEPTPKRSLVDDGSDMDDTEFETKKIKLEEDTWKRAPKKVNYKFNKVLSCAKLSKNFNSLPRNTKSKRKFIILKFSKMYRKLGYITSLSPSLDILEYKTLEGNMVLYNSVVDMFISTIISIPDEINAFTVSCEEGANFFYKSIELVLPLESYTKIFIPIIRFSNYTLVYLDINTKQFFYFNPLVGKASIGEELFKVFKKRQQDTTWTLGIKSHAHQNDVVNCGVFVCHYVDGIINNNDLTTLDPNIFREKIREVLISNSDDMEYICLHCGDESDHYTIACCLCRRPTCPGCFRYYYPGKEPSLLFVCELCTCSKT